MPSSTIELVILQHPQEAKSPLNTIALISELYPQTVVKKGLSWPSLKKILANEDLNYKEWGVLFLGSKKDLELLPQGHQWVALDPKTKKPMITPPIFKGLVLIDGNWQQSKTIWWRNAWLKKLSRIIMNPPQKSQYGNLRKEPRRNAVSSIEAASYAFELIVEDHETAQAMRERFKSFLSEFKK